MSVIITGMDMPKENNCKFCEKDCFWQGADVDRNDHIEDCPLKSVDGLIEEIKKMKITSGVKNQGTWNECLYYVTERIKEYCEVSE